MTDFEDREYEKDAEDAWDLDVLRERVANPHFDRSSQGDVVERLAILQRFERATADVSDAPAGAKDAAISRAMANWQGQPARTGDYARVSA